MISLQVLSCFRRAASVKKALELVATELNRKLATTQGCIARMDVKVGSGLAGGSVHIALVIDESDVNPKSILWVNEVSESEGLALLHAQTKLNKNLEKLRGVAAGFYMKLITPLPRRSYATIIVAVNEEMPKKFERLSIGERRERLLAVLRLLGNDPKAINLVGLARNFGVSRDTLYKDLQELGVKR